MNFCWRKLNTLGIFQSLNAGSKLLYIEIALLYHIERKEMRESFMDFIQSISLYFCEFKC